MLFQRELYQTTYLLSNQILRKEFLYTDNSKRIIGKRKNYKRRGFKSKKAAKLAKAEFFETI